MIDCLVIGFNDGNLQEYVGMLKSMGKESGAFKDLDLSIIYYDNQPYRVLDILTRFYYEGKNEDRKPFHNSDFLWPVITYLGSYLSRKGFTFDYVNLFQLEKERLKQKLLQNDILTIAVTTTLYVSPHPIQEIITFIRKYNKTAKIIVGGPFIAGQLEVLDEPNLKALLKSLGADFYVISSEGEATLEKLLTTLKKTGDLSAIDNIAYRRGDEYRVNKTSIESNSLEENMVDYSLFPSREIGQYVTTRTAKSCPFSCAFCGFPERAGKYTYLNVGAVERELNAIRDTGNITTLTFIDDTFNVPKPRFKELLRMMIKNKYPFKWNCLYRSDHGDEEAIELMGKAGCEGVFLGIESGSDEMLQHMTKAARRKDYLRAIPLLRQAGISTYASLIIGFPGETYDTVRETIDLVEEAKPDYFRAQLWYCDPLTPIWNKREEYGIKGWAFNWSHNTMDVKTACDLIDNIFLSIKDSIWLPQYGFEQWSTFYLQRRGMTVDQIKTLLKCFNGIIKEKIVNPDRQEPDLQLIDSLKRSCQFDRNLESNHDPLEIYSGSSYQNAKNFWINECGSFESPLNLDPARHGNNRADKELAWIPIAFDGPVQRELLLSSQANLAEKILAAFSILLSRLSGRSELLIAAEIHDECRRYLAPLRLGPDQRLSFSGFVEHIKLKIEQSSVLQTYGFFITTNRTIMAEGGYSCPVFEVGYAYSESGPEGGADQQISRCDRSIEDLGLTMILKVNRSEKNTSLGLLISKQLLGKGIVERIQDYLVIILQEVGRNPQVLIKDVLASGSMIGGHRSTLDYESETFSF